MNTVVVGPGKDGPRAEYKANCILKWGPTMTMICCCTEKVCLYEFLVMHLVAIA